MTHWPTRYVDFYIAEEGYDWECLGADDEPGGADGYLFASNPSTNSACTFYFPWFWNKTVMDRASTVVHEATHEFSERRRLLERRVVRLGVHGGQRADVPDPLRRAVGGLPTSARRAAAS